MLWVWQIYTHPLRSLRRLKGARGPPGVKCGTKGCQRTPLTQRLPNWCHTWCTIFWLNIVLRVYLDLYVPDFQKSTSRYYFIWEGPASQPQSTLSCWKNLPPLIQNSDPPPKLGPQKTVSIIAFTIALTLDVKIVWFGRQLAVCVQKRHKSAIFVCSWFQKFNFDCLLLKLLICSPTTENIVKFVCPLLTQSSMMISGTEGYSTLFLALSHKSWRYVKHFKKVIS